ncbi:cysteine hydrolase [Bradyrhizobium sp. U87765 SZCCT0131]|uniref:cysteine hydrolase family protein n=1 Tax=unclassified Bradyrhizobium TaxID=2631580 RepID=UPI001BA80C80|nr:MULTISPECIES: cysteine hydrolase family protein [unclassified Bradyrhizobium]MBR1217434.1 cysteine hydrolase [Bradyrhizobium sp. U87765 SZCCT0131]MBR1264969.1 cysteine hydrolase [Bradyrhizobium sp. U87765 SZCCT0134]MBR1304951.1 cysteine hydrolase [Bradyrhizobium sp. U87765 SZCCT0110]MBR1320737.1 cysteine hydrolase [Bradyrhizobium sp. U87765 SZCCT0109]MBR1349157.1 cysteine hydrolase [Bradyrhizobium sp. U87765 SZCCT0048]
MTAAKTLLELAGADLSPARLSDASLVLIDLQNEYLSGPIALPGASGAVTGAARVLAAARRARAPVFHIAHKGKAGGLFDREAPRGQIVSELTPQAGEAVIEKALPNSFAGTDLQTRLAATGRKDIVIVGLMTHMCVSSTARAALDLGFRVTIDAGSCATRALPDGRGGEIPADVVHEVALVELSDRFAVIVRDNNVFA